MKVGDLVTHVMWNAERGLILRVIAENKYLVQWFRRRSPPEKEEIAGIHLEVLNESESRRYSAEEEPLDCTQSMDGL